MNDTVKWVLIGLGAYLLYEQYAATPALATASAPSTSTPSQPALPAASAPVQLSTAQQQAITTLKILTGPTVSVLQQRIQNHAGADAGMVNGTLSQYQWNYYTTPLTGLTPPDLGTGSTPISFNQYWTLLVNWATAAANSPTGMAGLRGASATLTGEQKKKLPLIAQTYDMQETSW